jgi:thioesterase domain-containing protein
MNNTERTHRADPNETDSPCGIPQTDQGPSPEEYYDMAHVRVTIESHERTRNSRNGNPRYLLHTDRGTYHIAPDVSWAYDVTNHRYPMATTLTLNGWGKVTAVEGMR